jgi:hypothetical protein
MCQTGAQMVQRKYSATPLRFQRFFSQIAKPPGQGSRWTVPPAKARIFTPVPLNRVP